MFTALIYFSLYDFQVMYMCYLLKYKPIAEGLGIENVSSSKQEKISENKPDPIDLETEREVIHYYMLTYM